MRGTLLLLPLVTVVCVVAACGQTNSAPAHPSSSVAIRWLRAYGLWRRNLIADLNETERARAALAGSPEARTAFDVAAGKLANCASRYEKVVGSPPVPRLQTPAHLALVACRKLADAEKRFGRATQNRSATGLTAADAELTNGAELRVRADVAFEHAVLWNRKLPRIGGPSRKSRIEPLFGRVGASITYRPVEIRCWSKSEWRNVTNEYRAYGAVKFDPAGFAVWSLNRASLDPRTCRTLDRLAYTHEYPRTNPAELDTATAVNVLSHEIQHLEVPSRSEADVECFAVQEDEHVARGLGAPSGYARELALRYWRSGYLQNPPTYRTPRCHDGGPLDEDPSSSRWP